MAPRNGIYMVRSKGLCLLTIIAWSRFDALDRYKNWESFCASEKKIMEDHPPEVVKIGDTDLPQGLVDIALYERLRDDLS